MINDIGAPIVRYRFIVTLFTNDMPNPIDIGFSEVNGLKLSREIALFGNMTSLKSAFPLQTLTLKRGIFTIPSPLTITNLIESDFWKDRLMSRNILVSALDSHQEPAYAWLISNTYLEHWDWNGLNGNSNELLIESMSFKYTQIKPMQIKFSRYKPQNPLSQTIHQGI